MNAYGHTESDRSTAALLAERIRHTFLNKPFGIIKFWAFGVVQPNDQSYELVSTHSEGDRLDLVFVHESRAGLASILSIWDPQDLEMAPDSIGSGIAIRTASRVQLDNTEALREGTQYLFRTPRGEGTWPITTEPALVLAR